MILLIIFVFNGYDFNACSNTRNILNHADVMTNSVVKLIVRRLVGKFV